MLPQNQQEQCKTRSEFTNRRSSLWLSSTQHNGYMRRHKMFFRKIYRRIMWNSSYLLALSHIFLEYDGWIWPQPRYDIKININFTSMCTHCTCRLVIVKCMKLKRMHKMLSGYVAHYKKNKRCKYFFAYILNCRQGAE